MKRKSLTISMAVFMAVALLSACNGSSDESGEVQKKSAEDGGKVTLNLCWWGNQKRNDVTKKAVDLYMSQNPNVEIKVEFTDWSGYWDKLSTMAAGGNLPDIIQQDYSYLNPYQKSGQLADLTTFIEDGTIDISNISESIISSGTIDGKCYGISLGSNAPCIVYDKGILEEAGVTLPEQMTVDDLYSISVQIYEKTGVKTFFDGGDTGTVMPQMVARSRGSHLFDELKEGRNDAALENFTNVERFGQAEFCISPDLLAEKNPNVVETKPIVDGTTWNDFCLSNELIGISGAAGRELGITMYPIMNNAKSQNLYLKPGMFFSIAETSQHKEEAAKFINWFVNSIECNEILLAERGIPVNSEVAEILKSQVDEVSQEVFEYIASVSKIAEPIDDPDPAGKGEVEALGKKLVEDLRYGDITAEEAAKQYAAGAKKILEEAAK